ncbi:hypothetical protein LX69_01540 [Breznakibacter xylanolyticus]|uniref:Uncharacterized protein n=2 Tax=Breznakibacter xylanolyticus TaxID=990 RepID=A0A2W7N9X3_9BACT|nr:hypothetical protein LX69_01540 [Breznakibacter xylanolyticus]
MFSMNGIFSNGFASLFMKLIFVIIIAYLVMMVINFLRDKFINKEPMFQKNDIGELLQILYKVFIFSGLGFMVGNIVQFFFTQRPQYAGNIGASMIVNNNWDDLKIGIILIFIAIGFNAARIILDKRK